MPDGAPPRLGSDTLRTRAANSAQIFEARQRTRQAVAEEFATVDDPARVGLERREGRFRPREGFLKQQRPREAAFQLNDQFPRQDLGPQDVRQGEQGFRPTEGVRRRSAAFEFEAETRLDDVNPQRDIVPQGNAFGLAEPRQRDIAAARLDDQFPRQDLEREDVTPADDGFEPTGEVRRRAAAFGFESATPLEDVDPFGDVIRRDGEFGLAEPRQRDIAAARLDDEFPRQDLEREDVTQQDGVFGLTDSARLEIGAARLDEQLSGRDVTTDDVELEGGQVVFERRVY